MLQFFLLSPNSKISYSSDTSRKAVVRANALQNFVFPLIPDRGFLSEAVRRVKVVIKSILVIVSDFPDFYLYNLSESLNMLSEKYIFISEILDTIFQTCYYSRLSDILTLEQYE